MFRPLPLHHLLLVVVAAVGLAVTGCDPKRVAGDGSTDLGDGDDGGDPAPTVSDEAAVTGAVLSLHMDVIRAGLALAADFDSLSASPLPPPRAFFTTNCLTVSEIDPQEPSFDLSLAGCVDGHGTEYRGGGIFEADGTFDGYTFFPYGDAAEMIIADNSENTIYNHTYKQGTLWFTYSRQPGDGAVQAVVVSNYLRHVLLTQTCTFSYDGTTWTGEPGSMPDWPSAGSIVHVSWEGVGLYDITFTGGSTANFTLGGVNYIAQMSTGDVTIAPQT